MFETSGSWPSQLLSPLESSVIRSGMLSPLSNRQHEALPVSLNPCGAPTNPGFNEFGIPEWPVKGLASEGIGLTGNSMFFLPPTLYTPSRFPPKIGEASEAPCPEQRKFLIFDQSGNGTRLMLSSLCPGVQNLPAKQFGACKIVPERQTVKDEQVYTKTPIIYEESGENGILDEEREMREDTEEINALLYSDDDDDQEIDDDYEDDDTVSTGHSPLARDAVCNKQEGQQESDYDGYGDVAISSVSSKRRKALYGGHEKLALFGNAKIHNGDFVSDLEVGTGPTIGSKRARKDKIRDTLKALESILPGLKNKDPVSILDEAISYLKCMKYNAESISLEDSDGSGCYEPLN